MLKPKSVTSIFYSAGFLTLALYFSVHYVPQLILHRVFYDDYFHFYRNAHLPIHYPLLLIVSFFVGVIVLERFLPPIKFRLNIEKATLVWQLILNGLIGIFVVTAIYFWTHFDISFRHNVRLSDAGGLMILLWALRPIFTIYTLYHFSRLLSGDELSRLQRVQIVTILLCFFMTLNASLDVILLVLLAIMGLFPSKIFKKIFRRTRKPLTPKSIAMFVVFIFLTFTLGVSVVYVGVANKIGGEEAKRQLTNKQLLRGLGVEIMLRLSSYYASVLNMNRNITNYDAQQELMTRYYYRNLDRFQILLPVFNYKFSNIEQVNRLNYQRIYVVNGHPRAGASPGLVGSAGYLPIFPFNMILMMVYTLLVVRAFNRYIPLSIGDLSIATKLFLLLFMGPLLGTPIQNLSIFEPEIIYFVSFILGSLTIQHKTGTLEPAKGVPTHEIK